MEIGFILLFIGGCWFVYLFVLPKTLDYLFKKYREYREKKKPKKEEQKIVFLFKV